MELRRLYQQFVMDVMRSFASTYSFASFAFPKEVREDVASLYAFVRIADEIVDNPVPGLLRKEQMRLLDEYYHQLEEAVDSGYATDPVVDLFALVVQKYDIPLAWIHSFIESMKMDAGKTRYQTYSELYTYTYGSAEVVGMCMARIFQIYDKDVIYGARMLGRAFQMTNFMRDVREDFHTRGRLYFPMQELRKFGVKVTNFERGRMPKGYGEFVSSYVSENEKWYTAGNEAISMLPSYARRGVRVASILYHNIDYAISRDPYTYYSLRYSNSMLRKVVAYLLLK